MTPSPKPFARTRLAVRRSLKAVLPDAAVDAAQAAYLGRWWLPRAHDDGEPDLVVARSLLHRGATAIDGGANFGRYADAFAQAVGPTGCVAAIEPIPRSAALLRRVMRHRGRLQVVVFEAALASGRGVGQMEIPTDSRGETNFFRARLTDAHGAAGSISVALETLDEVAGRLPATPDFVKLDLEGNERDALAGASALLETGAAWLIEMNDDPDDAGTEAAAIEAMFASRGYGSWTYDGSARQLSPRGPAPRGPNVFFLLPSHLDIIAGAGVQVARAIG